MGLNSRTVLAVVVSAVIAALLVLISIVAFPGLVGGDDAYIVTSNSMEPTIESGDIVVTKATSPDEIETGDIVTFRAGTTADRGYVTHRVVEIREENGERYFKTKGDANDDPDAGYVPSDAVRGVQHRHVPYFGYLLVFARSSVGRFALVIVPGLVLVAAGGYQLLREFGYGSDRGRVFHGLLGATGATAAADTELSSESDPDGRSDTSGAGTDQSAHESQDDDIRPGDDR